MIEYHHMQVDLQNESIKVGDITLDFTEFNNIAFAYERMCTATLIMDRYDFDEETAWQIADDVRERMADEPGLLEEDAIEEVLNEMKEEQEEEQGEE
jgi:hypothetical protein